MLSDTLDKISFWVFFLVVVLLPLFFLPFTKIPIETSKGLLLIVGLVVSIIFWSAARLSDGKIILPKSWLIVSGFSIVLVFFISTLFSPAFNKSLFGLILEQGTFCFILLAFMLMIISALIFKDSKKIKMLFFGLVISFIVVFLFQVFRLLLPQALSFGILGDKTGNLIGSWNTLGLLSGFSIISSLFFLEFFSISKRGKWLLWSLIALSILFIIIVNLQIAWCMLGIFSLFIFIYKVYFSYKKNENKKIKFPILSFFVVMLSLLFLVAGQFMGGVFSSYLGIPNNDIRPSFSSTMSVAKKVLIKNPILGSGPNRFVQVWDINKPNEVNTTPFWKTSFDQGYGILPTYIVTTGIVGILSWIAFFILLVFYGIKYFLFSKKNNSLNMEVVLFYIMSLYLFFAALFFPIDSVMFLLAFVFTGIFISISTGNNKEITISFLNNSRKSLISIISLVAVILITASCSFKYIESFVSVYYFQKSIQADTIPQVQSDITKAILLYPNDLYLRSYSNVFLLKLNSLVKKGSSLSSQDKIELQSDINEAISAASQAVVYDSTNYINYETLGLVYETVSSFGVDGAFAKAIENYEKASTLNPQNPEIKLYLARVSFSNGKTDDAKKYTEQAVALKSDYVDGLIFMSQVYKNEGNNSLASFYAKQALSLDPNNQNLIQYVSSIKDNSVTNNENTLVNKNTVKNKKN